MGSERPSGAPLPGSASATAVAGASGQLAWRWLGRAGFEATVALQEELRRRVLAHEEGETLLLVEHPPTITLGRSARPEDVTAPAELLRDRGVMVVRASRGGDVTYHGPGQLVAYPIVRLRAGVLAHVSAMAEAVVALLAEEGIASRWERDRPGVWIDGAKIAAVGVNVHRRVAIHGIAFNVTTELDAFGWIVPCGQPGARVTSLEVEARRASGVPSFAAQASSPPQHAPAYSPASVAPRLAAHLARALGRTLVTSPSS